MYICNDIIFLLIECGGELVFSVFCIGLNDVIFVFLLLLILIFFEVKGIFNFFFFCVNNNDFLKNRLNIVGFVEIILF